MERDARQTKTNADTTPATGALVKMRCPSSYAIAPLAGAGPPVTGRLTSAMLTHVSTEGSVWTKWGLTNVFVLPASLESTAKLTLMTVLTTPVEMEGHVLIKSMISFVCVSLLMMGKLAKEKWTPVDLTPVKMEQHVHPMETTRSILVLAHLGTRAPGVK